MFGHEYLVLDGTSATQVFARAHCVVFLGCIHSYRASDVQLIVGDKVL